MKAVSYIPWRKLSPSWCAVILQEHTPCEVPSQCRSVATYTLTIHCFVPYQSKAQFITLYLHAKLPLRWLKMCPYSAVILQISWCSASALVVGMWRCHCPSLSVQPGSPTTTPEISSHRDRDSLPVDVTHWKPISRGYYWILISDSPKFCFRRTSPVALSSVMFKESRHSAEGWQHSCRTVQSMAPGWRQSSANELLHWH